MILFILPALLHFIVQDVRWILQAKFQEISTFFRPGWAGKPAARPELNLIHGKPPKNLDVPWPGHIAPAACLTGGVKSCYIAAGSLFAPVAQPDRATDF